MANILSALRRGRPGPNQPASRPLTVDEILNGMTASLAANGGGTGPIRPLPRDPRWGNTFGPQFPFYPDPLDQTRPDGGVDPRFSEYPITWNLQYGEQKPIPFEELRRAAKNIDLVRRCIQARKKDIAVRDWSFTVSSRAINREALRSGQPEQDVAAAMNKKYASEIARANAFWEMPGKKQDYDWEQWLFAALEEYLVQDAIVVFPRRTFGGDLFSLDIVAGETIKPLRDQWGGKPSAPFAAFQQVLYGFPRGEFSATVEWDAEGKQVVSKGFGANGLYYLKRHEDVRTPFGMSAVEQALISAKLYLKRQGWMLAEYDEGTMPLTWIESGTTAGADIEMDAAQRRMWQDALNDEMGGNTPARHRMQVLPPGMKAVETSSADERYKPDYDLFLLKMLAMHFDVPISNLGFNEAKGLGSSGFHESQADNYERQATLPDTRWMSRNVTRISHEQLGIPDDIVHSFLGLDSEDEAAQDAVAENRVRSGRMTLNEDRARQNKPLYSFAEADMAMIMTTRGIVPIAGASKQVYPGEMLEPMEFAPTTPGQTAQSAAQQQQGGANSGSAASSTGKPAAKPAAAKPGVNVTIHNHGGSTQAQKNAELTAFRKWAAKRSPQSTATFNFDHLSHEEAPRDVQTDRRARFAFDLEPDDE